MAGSGRVLAEETTAYCIEYRDTINPNAAWSVILMDEGKLGVAERIGVSSQVWLLRSFRDRTVLALGFGAYGVRDQLDRTDAEAERVTRLPGLASIGMRYRINDTWRAQLTWKRVITDYHRDSDVFLLGAGVVV